MSEEYIKNHFEDIKKFADVIEHRLDDSDLNIENVINENRYYFENCRRHNLTYYVIYKCFDSDKILQNYLK